jgi:hypothetical protein
MRCTVFASPGFKPKASNPSKSIEVKIVIVSKKFQVKVTHFCLKKDTHPETLLLYDYREILKKEVLSLPPYSTIHSRKGFYKSPRRLEILKSTLIYLRTFAHLKKNN